MFPMNSYKDSAIFYISTDWAAVKTCIFLYQKADMRISWLDNCPAIREKTVPTVNSENILL